MTGSTETMPSLSALFEQAALARDAAPLFADESTVVTGAQAVRRVDALATGLASLGLSPGERVAFLCTSSVPHALAFFACQRIGLVPCALHVREPADRLVETFGWLGSRVLLADCERLPLARSLIERSDAPLSVVSLEEPSGETTSLAGPGTARENAAEELAYIVLSSGTTGTPKGAVHLQHTACASAAAGRSVYGDIGPSDRVLVPMGPSFAAWVNVVLPFLAVGASVVFRERFDPATYVSDLEQERVTYGALVPTMWRLALDGAPRGAPRSLRYALFSGEPGSRELVELLLSRLPGVEIRGAYMSAEGACASALVADHELLVARGKPAAAGRPIPEAAVRLVQGTGDSSTSAQAGPGEVVLRSPSIAARYWRDDRQTAERFAAGEWRSGDLGIEDADGDIRLVGRTDNVINTGGVKVHAEEVEAALLTHPSVLAAAAVGAPDPVWGTVIEAHVVADHPELSADDLLAHCRANSLLASMKVPKRVVFHEELPKTATGKILRRALRSQP